jgi:hypothetical protein
MNFTKTKIAAALSLSFFAAGAQAAAVLSMSLQDVIDSNTSAATLTVGPDGLGTDGRSGAFRFSAIDLDTYSGASAFSGNLNSGVITLSGSDPEADPNVFAPASSSAFTTGFSFTGTPFDPYNNGVIAGDISSGVLTFSQFSFAGLFGGCPQSMGCTVFNLAPGTGQVGGDPLTVQNLIQTGFNVAGIDTWAYRITWSHIISSGEDPIVEHTGDNPATTEIEDGYTTGGGYVGFNARWVLEGNITTAAPVPEASTYGMMVAGLGLVGMAVRRRRTYSK